MKNRPGLSIDISITNAASSKYNHGSSLPSSPLQTDSLDSTYRAEGLSIGRDYMRLNGTAMSKNISSHDLIVEGTIGRGISSVVKLARLKINNSPSYNHHHGTNNKPLSNGPTNNMDENTKPQYYALKEFSLRSQVNMNHVYSSNGNSNDKRQKSMLDHEIKTLCKLKCPCLVQFMGAFYEPGMSVTMVLEYMDLGSIADLLNLSFPTKKHSSSVSSHRLPQEALACIAYQIFYGLAFLHYEDIVHRDIKPANVLVHSDGSVKLSDLGIAGGTTCKDILEQTSSGLNHTVIGTALYMSPERVLDKAYGKPSDIWSAGLVLLECSTGGWNPFSSSSGEKKGITSIVELASILQDFSVDQMMVDVSHFDQHLREKGMINDPTGSVVDWSKEKHRGNGIGEVISFCLQPSPDERIPADILLQSPWFGQWKVNTLNAARDRFRLFLSGFISRSGSKS